MDQAYGMHVRKDKISVLMEDLKVRRLDKAYRGGKGKGEVHARTGLEGPKGE